MRRPRHSPGAAALAVALVLSSSAVCASAPPAIAAAAAVPDEFVTSTVAAPASSTSLEQLPDGRVLVTQLGGQVRIVQAGSLLAADALDLNVCTGAVRGLLGVAVDPAFGANGHVYLYYTHPGGASCVNRVGRFTMRGNTIDPASEVVLLDNIFSNGANPNHIGGELRFGPDSKLYVAIGDGGRNPRSSATGTSNTAAQDLSILNGKILRIDPSTGEAPADNPLVGQGAVSCRTRGAGPSTPTTPCAEIWAWGLRNPWRFSFDTNTGPVRMFINDVGEDSHEEVDLGAPGANYGWPMREGACPSNDDEPCAAPPAGLTDPITEYSHTTDRKVITGGAFVPDGVWPTAYDGGYLFADGGSGEIWLMHADGSVDYDHPFATGVQGIADMAFVREGSSWALWFVIAGGGTSNLRRIGFSAPTSLPSSPLVLQSVPPGTRLLDTRLPANGPAPVRAGTTRYLSTGLDGAKVHAVLVNVAYVRPLSDGYLTAWAGRGAQPTAATVNATAGEVVSNMSIIPLDADGGLMLFSYATADVVIDLLGEMIDAPAAAAAGRFTAVDPLRIADTRQAADPDANRYTRVDALPYPVVRVPVLGRAGVPTSGVSSVVAVVTALSGGIAAGGFLAVTPSGQPFPGTANLTTNGGDDIRPNTVVVPVGPDGSIDLHLFHVADVVVDISGWFGDASAPPATAGRFVALPPTRVADSRIGLGFARLAAGATAVLRPGSVPAGAMAMAQDVAIVGNDAAGFVSPYPGGAPPLVAAGNVTAANQVRAVHTITRLAADGSESYYAPMGTDLVVDVTGWFTGS